MLRVVKVFGAMPHSEELKLMVDMIASAFFAALWAFCILFFFDFLFALFFMGVLSNEITNYEVDPELHDNVRVFYGSVLTSVTTLIAAISGGIDWFDVAAPLREVHGYIPAYAVFVLYVVSMVFGLLNILTAVVVEATRSAVNKDREQAIEEEKAKQLDLVRDLRKLMREADEDGDNYISRREFDKHLDDPNVRFYLNSIGIARSTALIVFKLQAVEGTVEIDNFVNALYYYHNQGNASHADIARLIQETVNERKRWAAFARYADAQFRVIIKHLCMENAQLS